MCINNCFFKILLENFDTKIYFTKLVYVILTFVGFVISMDQT